MLLQQQHDDDGESGEEEVSSRRPDYDAELHNVAEAADVVDKQTQPSSRYPARWYQHLQSYPQHKRIDQPEWLAERKHKSTKGTFIFSSKCFYFRKFNMSRFRSSIIPNLLKTLTNQEVHGTTLVKQSIKIKSTVTGQCHKYALKTNS